MISSNFVEFFRNWLTFVPDAAAIARLPHAPVLPMPRALSAPHHNIWCLRGAKPSGVVHMAQLQSMTGFASAQGSHDSFDWTWELRGVNGKGLDLRIRAPDWIEGLEAEIRKAVTSRLKRGNVTVNLRLSRRDGDTALRLNAATLGTVLQAMADIEEKAMAQGLSLAPSTAADIVALRGVLDQAEDDTDSKALKSSLIKDFQSVLDAFCEMRANEGAALDTVLRAHLSEISRLVSAAQETAEARRPKARAALEAALQRVIDTADDIDESRVVQELALLAVKADITEEINRLEAHVKAANALLDAGAAVGRKLDFLMQEFNREANTLCSKSGDSELTSIGLALKAQIDQLREQVQNVE